MSKPIKPQTRRLRARERLLQRASQRDEDVLGSVVVVDVEVALAAQVEGPAGVLGQRVQHVVEEADAGVDVDVLGFGFLEGVLVGALGPGDRGDVGELAAVDAELDLHLGLFGVAVDGCGAGGVLEGVCGGHGGWLGCCCCGHKGRGV